VDGPGARLMIASHRPRPGLGLDVGRNADDPCQQGTESEDDRKSRT